MKYVYTRHQFINEVYSSDKDNTRFQDTLLGGLLNRALGEGRSKKTASSISGYMDQLEELLANYALSKDNEDVGNEDGGEEGGNEDGGEEGGKEELKLLDSYNEEGYTLLAIEYAEESIVLFNSGKIQEALKKLPSPEMIQYLPKEVKNQFIESFPFYYGKIDIKEGMVVVVYGGRIGEVKSIKDDTVEVEILPTGKTQSVNLAGIKPIEITEDNSNNFIESLRSAFDLKGFNCKKDLEYSLKNQIEEFIKKYKSFRAKPTKETFMGLFEIYIGMVDDYKNCTKQDPELPGNQFLLENFKSILESKSGNKTGPFGITLKTLEKDEITKIQKYLKEERKKLSFDPKELNDEIKDQKTEEGTGGMTGDQLTQILDIVSSAKDKLFARKPYEQLVDAQKRYFDELPSSKRAINRKAYQAFNKKLLGIASYFKDVIPKQVTQFLTEAANQNNIADDYVEISQKLLGIETSPTRGSRVGGGGSTPSKGPEQKDPEESKYFRMKTDDEKIGFVPINKLVSNKLYNKIGFAFQDSDENWWSCIVVTSLKDRGIFNFKYVKGKTINTKWMTNYFPGKKIIRKIIDVPEDKIYDENFNSKGDIIDSFEIEKVNYAQTNITEFKKQQNHNLKVVEDISSFDNKNITTKDINVSVSSILILVGENDKKTAETETNETVINNLEKDKFLSKKELEDIADKSF